MIINKDKIGEKVQIEGIVTKTSNIYLICTECIFICPNCGALISIVQSEEKIKEPRICSCGWKRFFELKEKKLREQQDFYLTLSEIDKIKIYLITPDLIKRFSKIKENSVKVRGFLESESKKKSVITELVIYAEDVSPTEN